MSGYRRKGASMAWAHARPSDGVGPGLGGTRHTADAVAGRLRRKAARGGEGSIRDRVVRAMDAISPNGEPVTYADLVAETGAQAATIRAVLSEVRKAGWRWGRIVAAQNPCEDENGPPQDELRRRAEAVRGQSIAATRDEPRPRPLSLLTAHAPSPVPLTELEEAKRTTDEMIRAGRRMGLIGPKAKRRRAG